MILLRADNNNAGVNITNFVMESAQHMNSGFGAASLVEECTCPEGYDGLSCQVSRFTSTALTLALILALENGWMEIIMRL